MLRIPNFLPLALLLCTANCLALDCKQTLNTLGPAAMQMPFDEFDQDAKGWRTLGNEGCFAEAALLIERYALGYDSKYRLLKWHLAQMQASAGNTAAAVAAAELSLSPVQDQMHPEFDWNGYVRSTIAFLKNDRPNFEKYRMALKAIAAKHEMNTPNAQAIDRLARCFGRPYAEAYSCNAP